MISPQLYINRGLPGSGKSTRARKLASLWDAQALTVEVCSSDDFFICALCAGYDFRLERLRYAHQWCQDKARKAMQRGVSRVLIDNTNVTAGECHPYVQCGVDNGYEVFFLEPETPWAFDIDELLKKNVHRVPREALERMLARWVPDMTVELALGGKKCERRVTIMTADEIAAACHRPEGV
jgi:predicted kinase